MFWDFAAISQLRNESHCAAKWHSCAKTGFAIAKYPTEWDFWCEIKLYHFAMRFAAAKWMLLYCEVALVCQICFHSCKIPLQRLLQCCGMVLQHSANFAEAVKSRRALFFPLFLLCFCFVFALKDFLSISLHFLLILIIQKPILHQNKLELKH